MMFANFLWRVWPSAKGQDSTTIAFKCSFTISAKQRKILRTRTVVVYQRWDVWPVRVDGCLFGQQVFCNLIRRYPDVVVPG